MSDGPTLSVLFAIPELDRGGPDRVLFEIITTLDRTRFTPSVLVSRSDGDYLSRLGRDLHVEVLGDDRSFSDRYPVFRALRYIRRTQPDLVLGTQRMILTLGVIAPLLPRRTRLILRQANDVSADFSALIEASPIKHRLARWITLANLRNADAVVCQSRAMQSDLGKLLGSKAKLHVIGNPVDVEAITRAASEASPILPGSPSLVSVGRLAPQKGYDLLLPALAAIRDKHPGMHLTIIGDGPDRAALEAQRDQLGLADVVTFAGFSKQPIPYVRAADLFVLASRYEGFPNAALEALACGTPVMLTDCPGANSEIVKNGVNGRLARSTDPADVARAIDTAIGELAGYDRERIVTECSSRYASRQIIAEYQQMFATVVHQGRA